MRLGYTDRLWKRTLVSGTDAKEFLHRLSTQKIKNLTPHDRAGFCLTDRLGMLTTYGFLEMKSNQEFQLDFQDVAGPGLIESFDKYRVMESVEWTKSSPLEMTYLWHRDFSPIPPSLLKRQDFHILRESCPILMVPHTPELEYVSYHEVLDEDFEQIRCQFGIPRLGMELKEKRIPFEVGLGSMVSVDKGCYTGQETLAKFAHRADYPRSLFSLKTMPTSFQRTDPWEVEDLKLLYKQENIGSLTSATLSTQGEFLCLLIGPRKNLEEALLSSLQLQLAEKYFSISSLTRVP